MPSWFAYLQQGLRRRLPSDRLAADRPEDLRQRLRNLLPYFKRHWGGLAAGAVLVTLAALISLLQPLVYAYLIDEVLLAGRLDRLPWVVVVLAGLKLAGLGAEALQQFYFTRFEQQILLEIQGDLFERVLHFPKAFFDEKETGYLIQRLTGDVQGLRWFFSSTLVSIASNLVRLVGATVMLVFLEWRLALLALLAAPGLAWSVRYFFGKLRTLSHHSMEQQAQVTRQVQESLAAAPLIKAFAAEERATGSVMGYLEKARSLALEQATVNWLAGQAINLAPALARGLVFIIGAVWVTQGRWQLGQLLAFQSYLGALYSPAVSLASISLSFQNSMAALERVSALFDIFPEENLGSGLPVDRLRGAIEFKNVSFSYDGAEPVLEDLSIAIAPGEQVAIVGPSGVGKTTLISLVLRFYRPTSGEIWFDDRPAGDYELGSLRRRIGYVSQSSLLLAGTLLDNLRYGDPDASMEKVVQAATVAGIHDFISGLPLGYESPVGERGVNLSEGQKQRLSIARALVKDPDILILDEPTAALDSLVERSIFEALPGMLQGKTTLIVAHRLSTVLHADRILLLREGRLAASGTHQELLEHDPYYREIIQSQRLR